MFLYAGTSVGNSDRPEELEGTTQLLQHQLELLGAILGAFGKTCRLCLDSCPYHMQRQHSTFLWSVVGDESVQTLLKDERLQKQILTVDTADDREKVKLQAQLVMH